MKFRVSCENVRFFARVAINFELLHCHARTLRNVLWIELTSTRLVKCFIDSELHPWNLNSHRVMPGDMYQCWIHSMLALEDEALPEDWMERQFTRTVLMVVIKIRRVLCPTEIRRDFSTDHNEYHRAKPVSHVRPNILIGWPRNVGAWWIIVEGQFKYTLLGFTVRRLTGRIFILPPI